MNTDLPLNTGFTGFFFVLFLILHMLTYIAFYVFTFNFVDFDNTPILFQVFSLWAVSKPTITFVALIYSFLNVTMLPLIIIFMVWIGVVCLGSIGLLVELLAHILRNCNTRVFIDAHICTDSLHCCVFGDTPHCQNLGWITPCLANNTNAGITIPQTVNDLSINSDFWIVLIFVISFIVFELIILIISYFVYTARLATMQRLQSEYESYLRGDINVYDTAKTTQLSSPILSSSSVTTPALSSLSSKYTSKSVNPSSFLTTTKIVPFITNMIFYFDDLIDALIPYITPQGTCYRKEIMLNENLKNGSQRPPASHSGGTVFSQKSSPHHHRDTPQNQIHTPNYRTTDSHPQKRVNQSPTPSYTPSPRPTPNFSRTAHVDSGVRRLHPKPLSQSFEEVPFPDCNPGSTDNPSQELFFRNPA